MSTPAILHPNPVCPQCGCTSAAKKGKRRNRLQTLQVYRCTECLHRFTGESGKNKTYPLRVILEAVSTFDLGHSLTEAQQIMRGCFHRQIPERTISSWLAEYRPLTTHSRLRVAGRRLYSPQLIIRSHTFHHQQVYRFQVHRAKVDLLMQPTFPKVDASNNAFSSGGWRIEATWNGQSRHNYTTIFGQTDTRNADGSYKGIVVIFTDASGNVAPTSKLVDANGNAIPACASPATDGKACTVAVFPGAAIIAPASRTQLPSSVTVNGKTIPVPPLKWWTTVDVILAQ